LKLLRGNLWKPVILGVILTLHLLLFFSVRSQDVLFSLDVCEWTLWLLESQNQLLSAEKPGKKVGCRGNSVAVIAFRLYVGGD
jgi:hypothetical protein